MKTLFIVLQAEPARESNQLKSQLSLLICTGKQSRSGTDSLFGQCVCSVRSGGEMGQSQAACTKWQIVTKRCCEGCKCRHWLQKYFFVTVVTANGRCLKQSLNEDYYIVPSFLKWVGSWWKKAGFHGVFTLSCWLLFCIVDFPLQFLEHFPIYVQKAENLSQQRISNSERETVA